MKITFTFSLLLILALPLLGQQPTQYSLYKENKFAFNPAYAGFDNSLSITGVYRTQWVGLSGAPVTQQFNAHMPLYILGGGVGASIENETIGSSRQTAFSASYARHLLVGKESVFSIGLSAGLVQRQLDGSKIRTPGTTIDDQGNVISHDENLPLGTEGGIGPTANVGAFYQNNNFQIGLSAVNLLGNKLNMSGNDFQQERTYFLYLGYQLDFSKNLSVVPTILLKSDVNQTQMDFSLTTRFNENIFVGGSLRGYHANSIDAVVLMGGFKLSDKISIGYAYDLGLSSLKTVNSGSHEIMLSYNLGIPIGNGKPPAIIYNPRSL
ncbi:MAG: type IX secretion system membrane protein PorP/SprF [Saprospiraceae bacterium]|nr:type IX secretion system membrane protein PorP/SprF [Saprospiraceae bacterium]